VTKTNALESLVIASFIRGLSVRDVEATLADALGDQAAISKSTVSSVCQAIKDEYEAWVRRRLDGISLDYLFLDASFFRMHPGSPAEPVLAAWGITTGGKPAFVGLAPGSGESADAWHDLAPGPRLVEIIDARISEMASRYGRHLPPAAKAAIFTHRVIAPAPDQHPSCGLLGGIVLLPPVTAPGRRGTFPARHCGRFPGI
jgi:Transposase, Mutator family